MNFKRERKRIMKKPSNFETVQAPGEFNPIKAGGYSCKIMQVEEMQSKSGLDMLKISIDVADGEYKDYYAKLYKADTRQEKKWGGVLYLVVDESTEYGTKNLKGFTTSVEKSNAGFSIVWGDKFCTTLKGKSIGCLFRKEQYINTMNETKWITKPFQFRSVEGALSADVPEDKYLDGVVTNQGQSNNQGNLNEGFQSAIAEGFQSVIEEELPFM